MESPQPPQPAQATLAASAPPASRSAPAPLVRWAPWLLGVGGVLFGALEIGKVLATDAQAPLSAQFSSGFHQVDEVVQMGALLLLSLGLVGFYQRRARSSGFHTAGFILALVGTELALALLWGGTVLLVDLAGTSPRVVDAFLIHPSIRIQIGLLGSNLVFGLGWVVFALAHLRGGQGWRVAWGVLIAGFLAFALLPLLGGVLVTLGFAGVAWSSQWQAWQAEHTQT